MGVVHFNDEYERAKLLAANALNSKDVESAAAADVDKTVTSDGAGKLDFSEITECSYCRKEEPKCLLCGNCRSIWYCSTECAKSGWQDRVIDKASGSVAPGHRLMCDQNKEQMSKIPIFQEILNQFPWARIENDGKFRHRVLLASRGLLGHGKEFGFWSEEPCCDEHGLQDFEWGTSLMRTDFADEKSGWKLPDDEIPWLSFDESTNDSRKMPSFPATFENNWKSYYEWRGLPLRSPAALLLHWPLSVYRILEKLKLTPDDARKTIGAEKKSLLVHYVGAEEELDYLPIFGELALLLPNTNLELIFFGDSPYTLLHSGQQLGRSDSILAKSKTNDDCVYSYTAPESLGGGSVRIILWGGGPTWTPEVLRFGAPLPDAIIGLNAGLGAYPEWQSSIVSSRAYGIPFGVTEFMEASLELNKGLVENLTVDLPEGASEWMKQTYGEDGANNLRIKHGFDCDVNPFMKPGQKTGGSWSRLPASVNAFTFIVTPYVQRIVDPQAGTEVARNGA